MVFSFFGIFCTLLPNQVEHIWLKLQFQICNMSELELFLLTAVLIPNFNTMDFLKILEKNQKLHIQIIAVTLKP